MSKTHFLKYKRMNNFKKLYKIIKCSNNKLLSRQA